MRPDLTDILKHYSLKELTANPVKLLSGLTNHVYKIETDQGRFVLKIIDATSSRARSLSTYRDIEFLIRHFQAKNLPVVSSINNSQGDPVTRVGDLYFLLFPYKNAQVIYQPLAVVSDQHAYQAGNLLGKMHTNQFQIEGMADTFNYDTPTETVQRLIEDAGKRSLPWAKKIEEKRAFLSSINESCITASHRLSNHLVSSHGDFMPHNLMWNFDGPIAIDWELAGRINPGLELMLALIAFSNFPDSNEFSESALMNFVRGYYDASARLTDNPQDALYGALNKGWMNWIVFNMKRSLQASSETEIDQISSMILSLAESLENIIDRLSLFNEIVKRAILACEMKSLTHTGNDILTPSEILIECQKIIERLNVEYSDSPDEKEKLTALLTQLTEFELGRFLIKNKGALSGYWTHYIILGFSEKESLHPLEKAILSTAPSVLATRERFYIFQTLLQKAIKSNTVVCSVPCGAMADLLKLNIPEGVENVQFVGIDLDKASIDLARDMAARTMKTPSCQFFQRDAWNLDFNGAFDVITTNGLNIYEGSDERVVDLYIELYKALKPGGKLIGSALSCPPGTDQTSEWNLAKIDGVALTLQKAVFLQILQATWSHFRPSEKTIDQLKSAGFQSVEIIWDTAKMFYSFEATKNSDSSLRQGL